MPDQRLTDEDHGRDHEGRDADRVEEPIRRRLAFVRHAAPLERRLVDPLTMAGTDEDQIEDAEGDRAGAGEHQQRQGAFAV